MNTFSSQEYNIILIEECSLVRTAISEERSTSIIRVTRIGLLGTTLA
jgi:hypothetical protein